MDSKYKIKDESQNKRDAILYNGTIESGGQERNYKNIVRLPNDVVENEDNNNNYIKVEGTGFETNSLTISCWVKLLGTSLPSADIVTHTNESGQKFGLIVNPNGSENGVGYTWGMTTEETDYDFGITIEKEKWTHLVLVIYKSGISRLFVNGIYEATHDTGFIRKNESFSNIEIGRFCGLIDNVKFFSDTLDFGNVKLKETAQDDVLFLYKESQSNFEIKVAEDSEYIKRLNKNYIISNEGLKVKYKQSDDFVKAHTSYVNNTIRVAMETGEHINKIISNQDTEIQDSQKYSIIGGPNEGMKKLATGNFRTLPGEITSE